MKSQLFNFHDVVLVLTIAQAILLAIVIPTIPTQNRIPSFLLASLLLLLGGMLAMNIVLWNTQLAHIWLSKTPLSTALFSVCVLLQGPLLVLYRKSLSGESLKSWLNALHAIPLISVLAVVFGIGLTGEQLTGSLEQEVITEGYLIFALLKTLPLVYVVFCLLQSEPVKCLFNHRPSVAKNDDPHAWEFRLSNLVVIGFFLHWAWISLSFCFGHFYELSAQICNAVGIFSNYLAVILVNLLVAFGVINVHNAAVRLQQKPSKKLTQEKSAPIIAAINHVIEEEKIFLKSDINLERFCDHLGFSEREVSQVINTVFKTNFFEFINRYRIDEAKRLLSSSEHKDKTILEIIYMSGFNSQSAFHRFFRRFSDMTPSQYRNAVKHAA